MYENCKYVIQQMLHNSYTDAGFSSFITCALGNIISGRSKFLLIPLTFFYNIQIEYMVMSNSTFLYIFWAEFCRFCLGIHQSAKYNRRICLEIYDNK